MTDIIEKAKLNNVRLFTEFKKKELMEDEKAYEEVERPLSVPTHCDN